MPAANPKALFTLFEFCEKLLESKRVAVVPGTAFGKGGEGFIRASYCYSTEHIIEALRRIDEFVKELLSKHEEITTVIHNINGAKTSLVLGERESVLYGDGYI